MRTRRVGRGRGCGGGGVDHTSTVGPDRVGRGPKAKRGASPRLIKAGEDSIGAGWTVDGYCPPWGLIANRAVRAGSGQGTPRQEGEVNDHTSALEAGAVRRRVESLCKSHPLTMCPGRVGRWVEGEMGAKQGMGKCRLHRCRGGLDLDRTSPRLRQWREPVGRVQAPQSHGGQAGWPASTPVGGVAIRPGHSGDFRLLLSVSSQKKTPKT